MRDLALARRRRGGDRRPRPLRDPRPRGLPHARVLRGRPRRGVLAPSRRARRYEELHAKGGGILSTVRATRAAGDEGLADALARHVRLDAAVRNDDLRGEVRVRARPRRRSSPSFGRSAMQEAFRPGSARTPSRPSSPDADAYVDFLIDDVLPEAATIADRGRRLPRARGLRRRAGSSVPGRLPRRRSRSSPARRPVHGDGGDPARDRARRALGRPPRGDRGRTASPRSPRATSSACSCPPARSSSVGPMPPGRALVDAGAAIALATDFNPGSAFCESLPIVCSLAATQLRLAPGGGTRRVHGERRARARLRRPQGAARAGIRRGRRPSRAPTTGVTSRTTSAGRSCTR